MPKILSGLLLAALMGITSMANAEYRSNDNDGFTLPPKPKKPSEQNAKEGGRQDPMLLQKQNAQENDGIKRPDAVNLNPGESNKRPSKDDDFNPDLLDGIKRPKNGN
jgi:hypothetical protein